MVKLIFQPQYKVNRPLLQPDPPVCLLDSCQIHNSLTHVSYSQSLGSPTLSVHIWSYWFPHLFRLAYKAFFYRRLIIHLCLFTIGFQAKDLHDRVYCQACQPQERKTNSPVWQDTWLCSCSWTRTTTSPLAGIYSDGSTSYSAQIITVDSTLQTFSQLSLVSDTFKTLRSYFVLTN